MLITAARLLRGPEGEVVDDAAVLIRSGRVVAAGPRAEIGAVAPDEPRRDHPGATILPGLIDGHVHLSFDAGEDPVAALLSADDAELDAAMSRRAGEVLAGGVTTVRDLGDRGGSAVRLRDRIDTGEVPGPRVLPALAPLTPPRGHCWFFGGEVAGEAAIRALVRRNVERGAEVIKVMASGGHITEGGAAMWEPQFTVAELRLIVELAHGHGVPVAAHAHGVGSIEASIAAGVDTIEHCTWMVGHDREQRRVELALAMAERGVAACCTTCAHDWKTLVGAGKQERARDFYGRITWLDSLGVPLVTGTDGGIQQAVFDDFVGMLELYVWLGMSPARVLELATTGSARALGLDGETGRVAAGRAADLLVVDGDPRVDLAALREVRLVLARGRAHDDFATVH